VDIIRDTGGTAVSVSQEEIAAAHKRFRHACIPASPEGDAALAGLFKLYERGEFHGKDDVVLFNTALREG